MDLDATDPYQQMTQMITGYWMTQIMRGAAHLSLAEHLAAGPLGTREIAQACGCKSDISLRFLRACASLGLVTATPDGRFASTPLLTTLRADDPRSLRGLALSQAAPGHWLPWGRFTDVLDTGRHQAVEALGANVFDYYDAHPEEAAQFSRSMSGMTALLSRELPTLLETRGRQRAVDIGGAEGALLRGLMAANPDLRGVLFDRPDIVANAKRAQDEALSDRLEAIGGDFFVEVPAGDLYLLKFILHDWDDAACLTILRNCRKALMPGGRIAIIELALDETTGGLAPLIDVNMMVLADGRERTFDQYRRLLRDAGFGEARATPTGTPMVLIEAEGA